MLSCPLLQNPGWKAGYEWQPTLKRPILFFGVVYGPYLDLGHVFHAILVIWSSLKQTGKCHSPDETFQCKMHRVTAHGARQVPKSEGYSEVRLGVGADDHEVNVKSHCDSGVGGGMLGSC